MYGCFLKDIAALKNVDAVLPQHQGFSDSFRTLRVATFNVHFFRSGFSSVTLEDSTLDALSVVETLNPDIMLFQEVPASALEYLSSKLRSMGFLHFVAAGSADVHVLPADMPNFPFPGDRLHACLASKLEVASTEVIPMLDGHAAHAEVKLGKLGGNAGNVLIYSAHLSVRCPGSKRRAEVDALIRHFSSHTSLSPFIILGGDLNQPTEQDYPEKEWAAIAADMRNAGLEVIHVVVTSFFNESC